MYKRVYVLALHLVIAMLLGAAACGEEPIDPRRSHMSPVAGSSSSPPSAAGHRAAPPTPDLGLPDADGIVTLPEDDAGPPTLPGGEAKKLPADPTIEFDWTETTPHTSSCEAGEYVGTFRCSFTLQDELAAIFGSVETGGDVRLTLTRSMNGEFLEISNGKFEAVAASIIGLRAMLTGKLDCSTNRFEAMLTNGEWAIGDPDRPFIPGGTLQGDIDGMYQNGVLSGELTLGDPMIGSCTGTWIARRTP